MKRKAKRAQEEMVGFGLILIIVAIIILAFVALTLTRRPAEEIKSYEVESFLQAMLQYTTDCEDYSEYLSVQQVIFECNRNGRCLNEMDACEVLNESVNNIINNVWESGEQVGYEFSIKSQDNVLIDISEGNKTGSYKVAEQRFSRLGEPIEILFRAYF